MDKIPCSRCGKKVLPETVQKTNGLCMPCYKGSNPKNLWQRAEDIAVRMGIMKDADRVGHHPVEDLKGSDFGVDQAALGTSIVEILRNRSSEDDFILVSHLCGLLMEKENSGGLDSFSKAEKAVYLVSDMIRQLDSGGFGTYFYNTGHLAGMLPESLDEIGARLCGEIVKDAISIYGKVPSNDYDQMLEELSIITSNFDNNPWEELDDRYFDLDEDLGNMIMDYVNDNREQFSL